MRIHDRWVELRRRLTARRTEAGVSAVIVAMIATSVLIPLGAIGADIARWYVEQQRVQTAADAAATAGVTFLPDQFPDARDRALEVAALNGYPNGAKNTVTVQVGTRPTQLRVTISTTVSNAFGASIGIPNTGISRTAVADYNGPAPMGSPCNTMGNEPPGNTNAPPVASQIRVPQYADCSSNPQFWAGIHGPDVYKTQGDQQSSRYCKGGEDGCASSASNAANTDFDPRGYFYIIRVTQAAVNYPIQMQIYDPAYAGTNSQCSNSPGATRDNANPFVTDAKTRYSNSSTYCSGDDPNSGNRYSSSELATVTSFAMRSPTDTLSPPQAPPMPSCARQYPGYNNADVTQGALDSGNRNYNAKLAAVFHNWVDLCTFTPTQAGDYYLQVRTNVALGGTYDNRGGYTGNNAVYTQTDDDTSVRGSGSNRFALRAINSAGGVSVSAWDSMQIFANTNSATSTFNLVRVIPAAATKTLSFGWFDVGDATNGAGTMKLLPPADSNLSTLSNCVGSGVTNGTLTNCSVTGITSASYNGKNQFIKVPIPANYTCQVASMGGCWWKVQVTFPGATVTDATTWTARINGEPVRLIE